MKAVSVCPLVLVARWVVVSFALVASAGCVSVRDYERMRQRAEKAEAAAKEEHANANQLFIHAMKQDEYIRQLHRGMELQAEMLWKARTNCET